MFDVRKKEEEEEKTMGLTEMLFLCCGWTWEKFLARRDG